MTIEVLEMSHEDIYKANIEWNNIPVWSRLSMLSSYQHSRILCAVNKGTPLSYWLLPYRMETNCIEREYRCLPYSAPIFLTDNTIDQRSIVRSFFEYMTNKFDYIELPLCIGFQETAAVQSVGAFVEWRHTNIIYKNMGIQYERRLRNHISNARKHITVKKSTNIIDFNECLAIKGNLDEQRRRGLCAEIWLKDGSAQMFLGCINQTQYAGIYILFDSFGAYLLHSWRIEEAPRGAIEYLITEAIQWTFNELKLSFFDFEGSVLYNIDSFFRGFNTKVVPYGYVHWSKNKNHLLQLVLNSINIEGRIV